MQTNSVWRRGVLACASILLLATQLQLLYGAAGTTNNLTCTVLSIEGQVEVARQGTANWITPKINETLVPGDQIRTRPRSRATLQWSDKSVLRVGELTQMVIAPPEKGATKPVMNLRRGKTYFFNRERPGTIRFQTPVASGAIRGTEFNLEVDDNGRTEVALIDGAVTLETDQGDLDVDSGELAVAEAGATPTKTPILEAISIIQWVLYYPAVVDPNDVDLDDATQTALEPSLAAYQSGDLLAALEKYPADRVPGSAPERVLHAALLLGTGQAEQARAVLEDVTPMPPAGRALGWLMAAVRNEDITATDTAETGSEWLARSYVLQSQSDLKAALEAAMKATEISPGLGAAWVRRAELEFGFGRVDAAQAALQTGMELAPRYAPAYVLQGFIFTALKDYEEAGNAFNHAIELDGGLGDAWLGRGLIKMRAGDEEGGRQDLQTAAAIEPQRSILRSYLGKAFSHNGEDEDAAKELDLAKKLDPNDPTPWLYSALILQEQNRINEAARDLQQSKALNDNRSIFRSQLLLDQDQAVRSANLAAIYRDAGMFDVSVREASRAVNYDYGNYASHLFLANSYDAIRDPKLLNLRYETPWFSELMLAHLLAPVEGGNLSENVSQQEYSQLFDRNHRGVFSSTEYLSNGDWIQRGSQYGNYDRMSYSLDAYYRTENGQRANNDLDQLALTARVKQQLTDKDSVLLQATYFDFESGDVAQYYNQNGISGDPEGGPSRTVRVDETQEPILLAGYHREWAPGLHTLFLGGRFDDELRISDPASPQLTLFTSPFTGNQFFAPRDNYIKDFERELEAHSAELQQIWQTPQQTLVVGARYQSGQIQTESPTVQVTPFLTNVVSAADADTDLWRFSVYAYEQYQVFDSLRLVAGVSYDKLHYPANIETNPIIEDEEQKDQISPKAGVIWEPYRNTFVRGSYTRSLGGVYFDTSVRLEPTQVAGFNQAFRSLIPEAVAGLVPGTEFETFHAGIDHTFETGTYVGVEAQYLTSEGDRDVGVVFESPPFQPFPVPGTIPEDLEFDEKSMLFTFNQLLGEDFSFGALYRVTEANLESTFNGAASGVFRPNEDVSAILHEVQLLMRFHLASGFFGQADSIWRQQSNQDYTTDIPGDDFWQFNVSAGYRFWDRRAEAAVGILNLTDQDYRLNPLTLYQELPHERMLVGRLKIFF